MKILRRTVVLLVALGTVGVVARAQQSFFTADQTSLRIPSLRERLTFGLQARLPREVDYVNAVADTVERGDLPQKVVDRTFFWARKRAAARSTGRRRRPIIYFMPALDAQAKQLRVALVPTP